jgi:putative MATE family efflux protein
VQRIRSSLRPWFGTGAFYKGALCVMLPVTVQQLINNMFNVVDNLMVGALDAQGLAMSAVSVANKPVILYNSFIFGLAGAGGLLISQYFGARDRKACMGLFWTQILIALAFGLAFALTIFCIPQTIMRIYVTDVRTVELGVAYLRIVAFSYLPAAVSGVCIFALRSLGQTRTSMLVSLGSMGVNALFNYLLIFGALGFPRLGVQGAALGTVIARLFEMTIYLTLMLRKRMYFTFEPAACRGLSALQQSTFASKARPLIINELLYSIGLNIFFWCFARMDEAAIPALTIAELVFTISSVIAMGNSSAVSVLIGTELGAGALVSARENCKKLSVLTLMIGLICTALCYLLAIALPQLYNVSAELRHTATRIAWVMATFAPFNFLYAFCFFVLRAGGDTRSASLLDSGFMWVAPVPAAILMALLLPGKLSLLGAVAVIYALLSLRVIPGLIVLKRGRWIRNITGANDTQILTVIGQNETEAL